MTHATSPEASAPRLADDAAALAEFVSAAERLLVLTGAGISTGSGIPDYRDAAGAWKRSAPILYRDFVNHPRARRRYWARSLIGWPAFAHAEPNAGHHALTALEDAGRIHHLITQNVDDLHQRAGSRRLTALHGTLDTVRCLDCGTREPRASVQTRLQETNPEWLRRPAAPAPDGDADLESREFADFQVPNCRVCGGILKPDVVFFGESVPRARVTDAFARLGESDALLVAGSSLMVYSGYRFVREARRLGLPIAILNLGRTRADAETNLRVSASCEALLPTLAKHTENRPWKLHGAHSPPPETPGTVRETDSRRASTDSAPRRTGSRPLVRPIARDSAGLGAPGKPARTLPTNAWNPDRD